VVFAGLLYHTYRRYNISISPHDHFINKEVPINHFAVDS